MPRTARAPSARRSAPHRPARTARRSIPPGPAARPACGFEPVEVLVDGDPAQLIDLSVMGAQVVSTTVLKPNQRVRFVLSDAGRGTVRCRGRSPGRPSRCPRGNRRATAPASSSPTPTPTRSRPSPSGTGRAASGRGTARRRYRFALRRPRTAGIFAEPLAACEQRRQPRISRSMPVRKSRPVGGQRREVDRVASPVGAPAVVVGEAVLARQLPRAEQLCRCARSTFGSAASAAIARPTNSGDSDTRKFGSFLPAVAPGVFGDAEVLQHRFRSQEPRRDRDAR